MNALSVANVQIGNIQIGNIQIGNDKIENDKIRNAVIGRMEWPFSATVVVPMVSGLVPLYMIYPLAPFVKGKTA